MSHTFPSPNPHPPNTYSLGEDEVLPSFDRRKETEKRKMTIRLKHDLIPACNKEGPTSEPSPQKPSKGILFNKSLPPSYLPFPRPTPTFSWPSHNPGLFCSWSQTSTISSTHHFLVGLVHTLSLMTFSHSLWHPHRNLKAAKPKAVAALQQAPHTHTGCWLLRPSTSPAYQDESLLMVFCLLFLFPFVKWLKETRTGRKECQGLLSESSQVPPK